MYENEEKRSKSKSLEIKKIIIWAVVGIAAVLVLLGTFRTIDAEKVGVRVTFGKVDTKPCYGLSMKLPLFGSFVKMDKTTQAIRYEDNMYTKDLQPAHVQYAFTYRINDANAPMLYLAAGREFKDKLIMPKLTRVVKDVVGRWGAQELISNRAKVQVEVTDVLRESLSSEFFSEISFELGDVDYSDEFEKGIEAKVLAEQKAQEAKNKTVQVEEEARQKVIEAKGDADAAVAAAEGNAKAMDIEGKAIARNPQVLKLRELEVQEVMAKSASGWNTVVMGGAGTLLNIPGEK